MTDAIPFEARIRATIHDYVRSFTERDRQLWLGVFAPDGVQEDPIGDPALVGLEKIGSFWDKAFAANRRIELTSREVYVCQNEAAMVWTITLETSAGALRRFSGVDIFTFDVDARIRNVRAFWQRNMVEKL